ncbi:MAG: MBL fold metallo-hydrolase [Oscillospiraceae bacterium]|nr:MBL fold metallo-hydrolase [Oscillospiraceae bacterium]
MEVRVNTHGEGKLATKVFFSDESGFEVASVIVMGKKDCVLIDTQWTLGNAHRVIAEILETGLHLTTIYVTHAHPDHYFGTAHIAEVFPDARVVALPEVCKTINNQFFGKMEHWIEVIGRTNVCTKTVPIEPLEENVIMLEGERLEIIPHMMGDLKYNSAVWIPSIKTLYGSDILFNEAHPFTCEVSREQRKVWHDELADLEKLGAEVIIPGHQKPGMPFDGSSIRFTRAYLEVTEEVLEQTKDAPSFYYAMAQRFPNANLFISNDMNSGVFKGNVEWNWNED